jgi:hypothetical protein
LAFDEAMVLQALAEVLATRLKKGLGDALWRKPITAGQAPALAA